MISKHNFVSGEVVGQVVVNDAADCYVVFLQEGPDDYRQEVGFPKVLTEAIDCDNAIRSAARAAINFAIDEGADLEPLYDLDGNMVIRLTEEPHVQD